MDALSALSSPSALLDTQIAKVKAETSQLNRAQKAGSNGEVENAKMRELAEEFEQIFLQTMLSTMMESTTPEAPFNGGAGETQWQGFLVNEYAGAIASGGGIGLADSIYQDMIRLQQNAAPPAPEPSSEG
jgi:Rod binding domain-containing protein